ncbi:PPM-type phosphatase-like domain - like 10 [Theobroma cacao]|nr:PPM-type phosphatase-like domain - like 10 [Theobroma cacao]WRX34694.1 PPM-type phosphatase-like domain - like 10 [Theobroma cacao]
MAEICCGMVSEGEASAPCEPSSRAARKRRMEIRRIKFVTDVAPSEAENGRKRQKLQIYTASLSLDCENAVDNSVSDEDGNKQKVKVKNGRSKTKGAIVKSHSSPSLLSPVTDSELYPKFGVASVCGRRRDMEDAVAIHPSFQRQGQFSAAIGFHYFGVYDGHGCSHVAMRCRERLHELVKEELQGEEEEWKGAMERSFTRMDKEVIKWNESVVGANCRCELQSPECDAVGSTAVVAIVTPDKIIVANCGDSRAVLCRNGKPVPLSSDHKPDRPDELNRIQAAGGRVIYWDGPRVLGVLAMSRAIGDNYLKPYVSCEPEVMITDRAAEDDCLILASDGLWDVVSNDTACGVARMCLRGKGNLHAPPCSPAEGVERDSVLGSTMGEISDKACTDASMLLTKLALARHSTDNVSVVVVDLRRAT